MFALEKYYVLIYNYSVMVPHKKYKERFMAKSVSKEPVARVNGDKEEKMKFGCRVIGVMSQTCTMWKTTQK